MCGCHIKKLCNHASASKKTFFKRLLEHGRLPCEFKLAWASKWHCIDWGANTFTSRQEVSCCDCSLNLSKEGLRVSPKIEPRFFVCLIQSSHFTLKSAKDWKTPNFGVVMMAESLPSFESKGLLIVISIKKWSIYVAQCSWDFIGDPRCMQTTLSLNIGSNPACASAECSMHIRGPTCFRILLIGVSTNLSHWRNGLVQSRGSSDAVISLTDSPSALSRLQPDTSKKLRICHNVLYVNLISLLLLYFRVCQDRHLVVWLKPWIVWLSL